MSHLSVLLLAFTLLQSATACSPANTPDSSGAAKYLVGRISFEVLIPGTTLSSRTTALYPIKWLPQAGPTPKNFEPFLPPAFAPLLASLNLDIPTRSFEGAAPDTSLGTFPLVQFMHGNTGSHWISMDILELIAARGFIVLASDAPCNSLELAFGSPQPECDPRPAGDSIRDVAKLVRERLFSRTEEFASSGIASSIAAVTHGAQSECADGGSYALFGHSRGGIYAFCEGSKSDADPNLKFVAELNIDGARLPADASCEQASGLFQFQGSFLQVFAGNDAYTPSADVQLATVQNNITVPASGFKASFGVEQASHSSVGLPAVCSLLAANPSLQAFVATLPAYTQQLFAECSTRGEAGIAADSSALNSIVVASLVAAFASDTVCAHQYLRSGAEAGPAATDGLVSYVALPAGAEPAGSANTCNDRLFEEAVKVTGLPEPEPELANDPAASAAALNGLPSLATRSIITIASIFTLMRVL